METRNTSGTKLIIIIFDLPISPYKILVNIESNNNNLKCGTKLLFLCYLIWIHTSTRLLCTIPITYLSIILSHGFEWMQLLYLPY